MNSVLSCRIHKGKIKITESTNINFTYVIDPKNLKCQCTSRCQKPGQLCKHLKYYLCNHLKVHPSYIAVMAVPRVKEKIMTKCTFKDGKEINNLCHDFLTDDDEGCCICQEPYFQSNLKYKVSDLYQCPACNELYHMMCFNKWGKDCPRCKYKHDINQGKDDAIWPGENG